MVSAQDYRKLTPLHELDASFINTVKHVQTETVMGEMPARYAVRLAEVIVGRQRSVARPTSAVGADLAPSSHWARTTKGSRPPWCTPKREYRWDLCPLPNMGATAPATMGGALAMASAEVVSAMVLTQLVAPGAPTFYSIVASVMDPRTAGYINASAEKTPCHVAGVQIAHDWGVPILGGAFGAQHENANTWQHGRDSVVNALAVPLAGADMVVGMGLLRASTLLVPEQIIYDDEIYHTHRTLAEGVNTSADGLGLDVITSVGPRGHFLAQEHTRQHMRAMWIPGLSHPPPAVAGAPLPDIRQRAKAKLDRILAEHEPEPLGDAA
jgi:trimethylamine--corrinoid protein Co-methyltransferase